MHYGSKVPTDVWYASERGEALVNNNYIFGRALYNVPSKDCG